MPGRHKAAHERGSQLPLTELAKRIESDPGVIRKRGIRGVLRAFGEMEETTGLGDDCGFMKWGDDFLLLTTDCIRPAFLEDPHFAGFAGVNVVVNDIYAMGGTPLMIVNTICSPEGGDEWVRALAGGMQAACAKFGVLMVGGHLDPDAGFHALSVSALGKAHTLVTSFGANPGDSVVIAFDLNGEAHFGNQVWDASRKADPDIVQEKLQVMVALAEGGMVNAARDISNAGVLGSLQMLLEASRVGAEIDLAAIPGPAHIPLDEWLFTFPSYGFVLAVPPRMTRQVTQLFASHGLTAAGAGTVAEGRGILMRLGGSRAHIFSSGTILAPD